jgi:CRP-like cAMP-binding protein
VGHWITVGSFEGLVTEITWRATKLRTKAGNLVVVPNNIVAKEAINNYSQPEVPTRITLEVGASYDTPPNETKAAILAALANATRVLPSPAPDVVLADFGGSALTFRVRFWINDFAQDERARDEVRTFIYYEFARRGIEIPYPMQVQISRTVEDQTSSVPTRVSRLIDGVPVLAVLPADARAALARTSRTLRYAAGECIVRHGEAATSMFLVESGTVDVQLPNGDRVATTEAGGYFGEMSLLTGAPRSATVRAAADCVLVEISGASFRAWIQQHPATLADLASVAATRQRELDAARASAAESATETSSSLLQKMRAFFGL